MLVLDGDSKAGDVVEDRTRFDLQLGMDLAGADIDDVWWRYAALGGSAGRKLLAARIAGEVAYPPTEQNRIAQALNELFLDRGIDTFPVAYVEPELPRTNWTFPLVAIAHEVREDARRATQRSAAIQRQAAALMATAARLMEASGTLTLARQARERAEAAVQRSRTDESLRTSAA